jgi:hypothetical protein
MAIAPDNQTDPSYLESGDSSEEGTGIFAVPDPQNAEFGAAKAIVVAGIKYTECVLRGEFTMAYKWIPKRIMAAVTKCPVAGQRCVRDCGHDSCLCVRGRCISA